MTVAPLCLEDLVQALREEFRRDPSGPRAAALLEAYASGGEDWRRFCLWRDGEYTRNLVELTDEFELILLCWDAGQESPIHNHEGQNCWMAILEGPMEELHFRHDPDGSPDRRVEPGDLRRFEPGQVAFIRDEIALHQVRTSAGKRAASLHLYAGPITECNCYCSETGKITRRELAYTTVRGEAPA